ncbi:MAG: hypothetical protein JXL97_07760 [Bacteroidales bacterium]|nr:hypothetical protein [Bacteroidales bacterium]
MNKIILTYTFLILGLSFAFSQEFAYQAELPKVDSSGYYHIFLSPDVTSKLNYKFSDIRIFDNKKVEVPFIRLTEDEIYKTAKNKEIKLLQNEHKMVKKYTYLLVHNSELLDINNLVLIVKNPLNAEAWMNISGSNDLKNWNILKNNTRYMPEFSDSVTAEIRITDLPESKFEYYRIFIFDYNKTIFNVNKVLNFEIQNKTIEYVEVSKPDFEQDDTTEANQTILKISFDNPQYIDKIKFYIKSPKYYLRTAEIVKKDSATGKRIRLQLYDQNQQDFYLCSDSTNELLLSRYFAKNLYLLVNNNDDKPLQFGDIEVFQREEFLVAYLEPGKEYTILFGNQNVPPPIYDLKFFKYKIPSVCPEIPIENITLITDLDKNQMVVKVKPIYLWLAFGVVILILAAISVRMFITSKKSDDEGIEL